MKVRKVRRFSLVFAVVLAAGLLAAPVPFASATSIPPSFSKSFAPSTIGPGSTTTLTFVIDNSDSPGYPADDVAFTDVLPTEITIADPASATNSCGGVLSAPDGGTTISLTDGDLGGGAICTITVNVTASDFGEGSAAHTNTTGDLTSSLGNSGTATADLTVDSGLPGFSKTFSPDPIPLGGTSTLTFLIDNTDNGTDVDNLSFTDVLPAGMIIATPANKSTDCGHPSVPATLTAPSGGTTISLFAFGSPSFPALDEFATCTVKVSVTTTANGTFDNVSGSLFPEGDEAGFATATLGVPRNTLNKVFVGDPATPGATISLEFTIQNPSRTDSLTGIGFTDVLSDALTGLSATPPPMPDPPCGAGSTLTGSTTLTFAGGSLAPEASCTFAVPVTVPAGAAPGNYTNTTSTVTGTLGGDAFIGPAASDVLTVTEAPTLTKEFTDDPVGAGGTVTLNFEIQDNTTAGGSTDIAFDDLLLYLPEPPGLSVTLPADGFCGGGSSIVVFDDGLEHGLRMTGGSLGAGLSCDFDVLLDIPEGFPGGDYVNTTSDVSATIGASTVFGPPASDILVVLGAPEFTKEFSADAVAPAGTVDIDFTISHLDSAPGDATAITFTDVLPGFTATGTPIADPCGTGSSLTGTTTLTLSGGTLAAGEECTFSVSVTESGSTFGTRTNTTGNLTATVLGEAVTGDEAEDDIVVTPVTFTKEFTDDPVAAGGTVTLEFTITNTSATLDATSISFTDDLDANLAGLAATGGPTPDPPCGAGSSLSGTTFLTFAGGSVPAASSCSFTVPVSVPGGAADDPYLNRTSGLTLTLDGSTFTQSAAVDFLEVASPLPPLVTKEFTDDPVEPGDTVTLEFTVTNPNTADAMTSIVFDDVLTDALAGLTGSPPPTPDPPCGAGSSLTGTTTLSLADGTLPAGGSCTFTVPVTVPGGAAPGSYLNETTAPTALVDAIAVTGDPASDTLDVVSATPSADVSVDKVDDADPVAQGATLTYTLTVTNDGPELAADVVVVDTLPAGVTFAGGGGCFVSAPGEVTCPVSSTLGVGATVVIEFSVTVTAGPGTTLVNSATVESTTPDPDSGNNTATEETFVGAFCNGLLGTIYGTNGDDMLMGTAGPDVIIAFGGNDRIYGFAGDDTICAGGGDDTIIGGLDDDTIFGQAGTDTVSYVGAPAAVTVDLGLGVATGGDGTDSISSVRNATGSSHDDTLRGNALANVLRGEDGHDFIDGRAGDDVMLGGRGDDVLRGRAGDDEMKGGLGTDTASYQLANVGVTINLLIVGPQPTGVGSDTLVSIEDVIGSKFGDTIEGNAQANTFIGMNGNDILRGRSGNDFLIGGGGFDSGVGGNGFDTCLTENRSTCEAP